MAIFNYRGRSASGKEVKGQVDASNQDAAVEALMRQGVIPLSVTAGRQSSSGALNMDIGELLKAPIALEPLVIFCRQMYSLTRAGVPLLRAIRGLSQSTTHKLLAETLDKVHSDLTNGRNFSSSLRAHPRVFSELFVSMVAVGESTGRLEEALLQLANYFEQEMETRRRIKSAMRYPIFVLSAIFIALVVLNLKVIPQFSSMFSKFGMDLPLPTKILIGMSDFFVNYWYWMIASMFGAAIATRMWVGTDSGRERWDLWRLKVPIVGDIVNRAQLSRFARSFSLMLKAGVPLNQSIQLSAEALGNRFLELKLMGMKTAIEAGSSMTVTANNSGVFTPLVQQMIAVGEETGQIDELLLEVADFYDREVDYDLKTLTARIEPILLAVVAGMVLLLALGIFLPMWDMLDIAKGG